MIPVKDRTGEVVFYVSPVRALKMIDKGYIPLGTKKTIRAIQVPPQCDESKPITLTAYTGQQYSHHHDTPSNPEGVWTLKQLRKSLRPIFLEVVTSAIRRAA
jgi:hypothetical protein